MRHKSIVKAISLAALLFAALLLGACGGAEQAATVTPTPAPPAGKVITTDKGQYTDVTAEQLKAMMDQGDFFQVDVHVPHEGMMPNVDARIQWDKIADSLDKLPKEKDALIVLTCKSGGMSTAAAKTLADLGYTHVYNLEGGFLSWKEKGYPFTPEP